MGAEKKRIITSINFGDKGTLQYIIAKKLMKEKKSKFSNYVRQLILYDNVAESPDYKRFKIKQLLSKRKFLLNQILEIQEERLYLEEQLEKLEYNIEELE